LIDKIKQILRDSPDIIGKDKYLNSAVLIPLLEMKDGLHLLFEKRSAGIRHGGEISFPGGRHDPQQDPTLTHTAVRETCEELGIEEDKIALLDKFGTVVAPMGLTIDTFAARLLINSPDELNFDKTEVEYVFTVPLKFFLENEPEIFYSRLEIHTNAFDENGREVELLPVKRFGLPDYYAQPWRNGRYRVIVYDTKPDVIWGLTAEIVFEFSKLLKDHK
jgi:8-oxo-dGTP pyrophosphatase MutT (NUDIX family)